MVYMRVLPRRIGDVTLLANGKKRTDGIFIFRMR